MGMKGAEEMFVQHNENPSNNRVGDCVIRALSRALKQDWEKTYVAMALQGYIMCDMPSANSVWGAYLRERGFRRHIIPDTCPDCYNIAAFCIDNPKGTYILATGSHVVCVEDGNYYDTWDSGNETPIYYWKMEG